MRGHFGCRNAQEVPSPQIIKCPKMSMESRLGNPVLLGERPQNGRRQVCAVKGSTVDRSWRWNRVKGAGISAWGWAGGAEGSVGEAFQRGTPLQ